LIRIGTTIGAEAHRQSTSLHVMLKELDLLGALLLHGAEKVACEYQIPGTGHEGLVVARRITEAVSQLRLAATVGYTQAMSDELRERYRAIRHDLRNPLGTIKSAVALLTDESVPAEMRESRRVRAMVARNTSSLDQLIGEMLGDTAARLRAFDAPGDVASVPSEQTPTSGGEKRDDVTRARE
jgi:signal transduction histidine kinase